MGHYIYRDYRPGRKGQFSTEEAYNRSHAAGVICNIHRERSGPPAGTIDSIEELFEFDDYDDDELVEYEFHGTGETGEFAGNE